MAVTQYQGTGRRKSSVARVRLIPGKGEITINKKPIDEYFGMEIVKREVRRPFDVVGVAGKFDIIATVHEGGPRSPRVGGGCFRQDIESSRTPQ